MTEVKWERGLRNTMFCEVWYECPYNEYGAEHGLEREYDSSSGLLVCETPWINGQRHGILKMYNAAEKVEHRSYWIHGEFIDLTSKVRLQLMILFGEDIPEVEDYDDDDDEDYDEDYDYD